MCKIFGYCRVSTAQQKLQRQIENAKSFNNDIIIIKEKQSAKDIENRTEFKKLLSKVKSGDSIVFDEVSRMSRNAEEGFNTYLDLYNKGINLQFLKEPYLNTSTYKSALEKQISLTGEDVDCILEGVNTYLMRLANKQIRIAFEQSQKEVDDLRQRTKEGIQTARINGKQIGRPEGSGGDTKKARKAKGIILQHSKDFWGTLTDKEVIKLCEISRNSFYKYKRELKG